MKMYNNEIENERIIIWEMSTQIIQLLKYNEYFLKMNPHYTFISDYLNKYIPLFPTYSPEINLFCHYLKPLLYLYFPLIHRQNTFILSVCHIRYKVRIKPDQRSSFKKETFHLLFAIFHTTSTT